MDQQDKQITYNVIFRIDRPTNVAVEKQ